MGWWSSAIMGGDDSLGCFGWICREAGVGDDGTNPGVLTREALNKALPGIVEKLKRQDSKSRNSIDMVPVNWQVLGVTIMERGADIDEELRFRIIKAARSDEWMAAAGKGSERGKVIQAFIKKLHTYSPGIPVPCPEEEGLLSLGGHTSLGLKHGLVKHDG